MDVLITGCIDCPLFDSTGSEYGVYCHHPKRPFDIEVSVSDNNGGIKNLPVLDNEKEYYEKECQRQRLLPIKELEKEEWMSIHIINEPIEDDGNYNPITPDWCPIKKEKIIIGYSSNI